MPWILAGGGVVVIAAVVVLIIVLTGGPSNSPEGVAQEAVDAANDKNYDAIADLACDADAKDVQASVDPKDAGLPEGITLTFELGKVEEVSDTEATAEVKVKLGGELPEGLPASETESDGKMSLSSKDGDWCITGMG